MTQEEIRAKIAERDQARKSKNYELADRIRDELKKAGIRVDDTRHYGTVYGVRTN